MKNKFFYLLAITLLVQFNVMGQSVPTQHFKLVPQITSADTAWVTDSVYANGNHDSLISIDYKIYRNGVLIDTMSKYGWAKLTLRQLGEEYVSGCFDSGVFVFPKSIPFAGMVAQSFTISVINAEPSCNRNRVPKIQMQFKEPGTYKVVFELYSQTNYKKSYIGSLACQKYRDAYSLVGNKKNLWTKDSVSFTVNPTYLVTDTVSVCDGISYAWRGKNYVTSGLYKDIRHNTDGSDSVYQLKLTVLPTSNVNKVVLACQGVRQYWRGKYYVAAGVYYDSAVNKYGCKDYYTLNLQIRPNYLHSDTMWVCKGESVKWMGRTITSTGRYTQVYTPVYHCDSIYELWIYNYPTYTFRDAAVICKGESYFWRGRTLTKAGVYTDSLKTIHGCDSLYCLSLSISEGFFRKDTADVCSLNGSYVWHGRNLTVPGLYTDSLKNRYGCDSVYQLDFRIRPAYLFTIYDTVQSNKNYVWSARNRNLGKLNPGSFVFWDSLKTVAGCDSVYKLCLLVYPAYAFHKEDSVCENGIYQWSGHSRVVIGQKSPGVYLFSDSLKTKDGSDSVYSLRLHVFPTYLKVENASVCANEIYSWPGHAVNIGQKAAGTYVIWDSLHTVTGCDSVYQLNLTVYPVYFISENASVCDHENYVWKGHPVTIGQKRAGTYTIYDSLSTIRGCDSIFALNLTVNPTFYYEENVSVCADEVYVWKGHSVAIGQKSSGTYTFWDSLKTINNCDSVYKLNLTVYPVYAFSENATTCANEAYVWQGHKVNIGKNKAGNYVFWDSLKTIHGCDSVYRLALKVYPTYYIEQRVTICGDDIYSWYGHEVSIGKRDVGTYVFWDSLHSVNACDSVFKLTLTVAPVYNFNEKVEVCANEIYVWKGHAVNIGQKVPGTYTFWDRQKTVRGCDSIYKLTLVVHPSYSFESKDSTGNSVIYTWHGRNVDTRLLSVGTHVLWDSLKTKYGCDSIYRHILEVFPQYLTVENKEICSGDVLNWRGRQLMAEGTYDDTLQTLQGFDSIIRVRLIVHPTHLIQEIVPVCSNSSYVWRGRKLTQAGVYTDSLKTKFGCDSLYRVELRVKPVYLLEDTIYGCIGHTYTWRGRQLQTAGRYTDSLKAAFGCDSVFALTLFMNPVFVHEDTAEICANVSYVWHGKNYCTSGFYTDSLQSVWGCDSICHLRLMVYPFYVMRDTQEICQNERMIWRGKRYMQAGVYSDSLRSIHGCDSVYTLCLIVHPIFEHIDSVTICSSETYTWRGRTLRAAGYYTEQLISTIGCDSIYHLQLMVNPSYYYYDTQNVCDNHTYYWRGRQLSKSGVYVDSLISADGCPLVHTLLLNVHQIYRQVDSVSICDKEVCTWHGRRYAAQGTYYDSLKSMYGCDSIFSLHLIVNPSYFKGKSVSICEPQKYLWQGRMLTRSGIYIDTLRTQKGCDSIWILQLIIFPSYVQHDTVHICQHTSYAWHGRKYFNSGVYEDSLRSEIGCCDSICYLHLHVDSTYDFADNKQFLCEGTTLPWRGHYLTHAGVYYDSLKTVRGCDSIYHIEISTYPSYYQEDTISICQNASYVWRGQMLTKAGLYYDRMQSIHGCDSIYALRLFVRPLYATNEYAKICGGEYYLWHGKKLTEQKAYVDTLRSVYGCDSVTRIFLYVYPHYHFNDTVNHCGNAVFTWRDRNFVQSGCYTDSFKTVNGCDSIYTLYLNFRSTYYQKEDKEICANNIYLWHGKQYARSGIYYDSLKSVYGCDSVFCLSLTVHPTYLTEENLAICQGEVCAWRGRKLMQSGTYVDSLQTINACDSIYRLTLKVNPVYSFNEKQSICQGETYAWRGRKLMQSGVYADSLQTISGCDSLYRLTLNVTPVYYFNDTQSICQGETYAWRGRKLMQSGVYEDSLQTISGCDSIYRFILNVCPVYYFNDTQSICQGETYAWRGRKLMQSGVYEDSLQTISGCDSIYRLQFKVYPVYSSTDTATICKGDTLHWQNMVLTQSGIYTDTLKTLFGCDSVMILDLIVRELPERLGIIYGDTLIAKSGVYMYYTDSLSGIDTYEWTICPEGINLTASGCKAWLTADKSAFGMDTIKVLGHHVCGTTEVSILPIRVTIGVRVVESETPTLCKAFPNPTKDEIFVEIPSVSEWNQPQWMLCDAQGRCLSTGRLEAVSTRIRMEDYARGVYVLRLFSENKVKATLKIVKY